MAYHHRLVPPSTNDGENLHRLAVKQPVKKLTRRPALDELSNRINNPKTNIPKAISKPEVLKNEPKKENLPPLIRSYSSRRLKLPDATNDPQMVSVYLEDIFGYLRQVETQFPIEEGFLQEHRSSPRMRSVLVNWLVQVHLNFKLCLETLHLCVSILDRYLQINKEIGRDNLQLVGLTALLIACKYEEMYYPDIKDFEYVCDDTFQRKHFFEMEQAMLKALDFSFSKPLSIHFLRRFSNIASVTKEQHTLGKYLLELALLDHTMSPVKPSLQAAAACCLSIMILNDTVCTSKIWTSAITEGTGCKFPDFRFVLTKFAVILKNVETSKYKSVLTKYEESKFHKISRHPKLHGPLIERLAKLTPK